MPRVEEILDVEKITRAQSRIVWIARASWAFVAMEIMLISFTLPLFTRIFGLTEIQQSLLVSSVLTGDIAGAVVLGRLSDVIGRRPVFQISLLWYALLTALAALSRGLVDLVILLLLAGIGRGGMVVVVPALLSELLPPRRRGRLMVSLDLFWPLGSLAALALSYTFLEVMGGSWRGLFLAAAFPALTVGLFRLYAPESPFYLAKRGRMDEAARVLERLVGRSVDPRSIVLAIEEKGSYDELFTIYRRRTAAMIAAWTALNYTYYGLFLWLPQILNVVALYGGNVWLYLSLAFLFQIPGYLSAMYLVERVGRRNTLTPYLMLSGIFGIAMALTTENVVMFSASMLLTSFFNLGAWGSVYPFTSELYPTRLRGKAFGLAEGVGKATAALASMTFGLLLGSTGSLVVPLIATMAVALAGAAAIAALAPETKGLVFD